MFRFFKYMIPLMLAGLLSGCNFPKEVTLNCKVTGLGIKCTIVAKASQVITTPVTVDASRARIDLSQSTIALTSNTGTFSVLIKNSNGAIMASKVFAWHRSGDSLLPSNPGQVSQWLNTHLAVGNHVEFELSGVEADGKPGNNTAVAILEYDGDTAGASASFYMNAADANGF